MAIKRGDVYWVALANADVLEPAIPHPHVIIQINESDHTVVACALTSNHKRVSLPGNVLLEAGEASLPRQSVVEVAKVITIEPSQLGDYIGMLDEWRIDQILAGIRFIQTAFLSGKMDENR
ncbi:MAG: type II toxin-antitoxin system PemK/MazF family toxin [Anaerolineae bacterium]|nr:type II toxin-antitoxin system PemK/MazF family toxin [Anaerolineae bacterium]